MKRYWLFSGDRYYPSGGMDDFKGCFDTVEEALLKMVEIQSSGADWWHLYDALEERRVHEWRSPNYGG